MKTLKRLLLFALFFSAFVVSPVLSQNVYVSPNTGYTDIYKYDNGNRVLEGYVYTNVSGHMDVYNYSKQAYVARTQTVGSVTSLYTSEGLIAEKDNQGITLYDKPINLWQNSTFDYTKGAIENTYNLSSGFSDKLAADYLLYKPKRE